MLTFFLFLYSMMWLITGVALGSVAYASPEIPEGTEPALGFLAGLLWPVTVTVTLLFGIVWCAVALARSFAVLWREL